MSNLYSADNNIGGVHLYTYGNVNDDIESIVSNALTPYYTKTQTDTLYFRNSAIQDLIMNDFQIKFLGEAIDASDAVIYSQLLERDASINALEISQAIQDISINAFSQQWTISGDVLFTEINKVSIGNNDTNLTGQLSVNIQYFDENSAYIQREADRTYNTPTFTKGITHEIKNGYTGIWTNSPNGFHPINHAMYFNIYDITTSTMKTPLTITPTAIGINKSNPIYDFDIAGSVNASNYLQNGTFFSNIFAPISHTHPISQITNLQTELNNKSNIGHTHVIGDVTGLQTELNGKLNLTGGNINGDLNVSGNVGINKTNPSFKLDVEGDTRVSGTISITQASFLETCEISRRTLGNNDWAQLGHSLSHLENSKSTGYGLLMGNTGMTILNSSGGNSIEFRHNNSTNMTILSGGNVGIGKSPSEKLDVNGTARATVFNENGTLLSNKYAPISHTHPISEIVNLQTSLNSKSNIGHTHVISDITNLSASLQSRPQSTYSNVFSFITNNNYQIDIPLTNQPTQFINYIIETKFIQQATNSSARVEIISTYRLTEYDNSQNMFLIDTKRIGTGRIFGQFISTSATAGTIRFTINPQDGFQQNANCQFYVDIYSNAGIGNVGTPVETNLGTNTALTENTFDTGYTTTIGATTSLTTLNVSGVSSLGGNTTISNQLAIGGKSNQSNIQTLISGSNHGTKMLMIHADNGNSTTEVRAGIGFSNHGGNSWASQSIGSLRRGGNGFGDLLFMLRNNTTTNDVSTADEKMRITAEGNIGIGTTNATSRLDINGNILIRASNSSGDNTRGIFFREGFVSSNIYNLSILAYDHSGDNFVDGLSINGFDGVSICAGSNTRQERMRITQTGNVGIGTTNPLRQLHILKTHDAGGSLDTSIDMTEADTIISSMSAHTNRKDAGLMFFANGSGSANIAYASGHITSGWATAGSTAWNKGYIDFKTHAGNNTAWTTDMRIQGGNVVVSGDIDSANINLSESAFITGDIEMGGNLTVGGTAILDTTLDVGGNTTIGGNATINGNFLGRGIRTANRAELHLHSSAENVPSEIMFGHGARTDANVRWGISDRGTTEDALHFYEAPFHTGGAFSARMTIKKGGSIGINQTNPVQRLEVNGNISLGHRWNSAGTTTDVNIGKTDTNGNWGGGACYITFKDSSNSPSTVNSGTSMIFATHQWGVATAERMRIAGNGNVGIGITTPLGLLDIDQAYHRTIRVSNAVSATANIIVIPNTTRRYNAVIRYSWDNNGTLYHGWGFVSIRKIFNNNHTMIQNWAYNGLTNSVSSNETVSATGTGTYNLRVNAFISTLTITALIQYV